MAITKVRVKIDGIWTNAAKNSEGKWTCAPSAPALTSHNMTGGYYPVTVEVTNDAGTVVTYDASDSTVGASLRLVVQEKVKPVITLEGPTNGTYSTNNKQKITFTVVDETSGSGVDLSTVALKIDSASYNQSSAGMVKEEITGGYKFTYTPQTALADGKHTITVNAKDYDGNAATAVTTTFTIDTVPPVLSVTSPANNLITNTKSLTLKGTTNDATSSPVTVTGKLNGTDIGAITVTAGSFTKAITAKEGSNTLIITAKDAAGKTSSVTVSFKVDTTVPQINSVAMTPNPAAASSSVQITIEVS